MSATCNVNSVTQSLSNVSQCNCTGGTVWINGDCVLLTDTLCGQLANSTVNTSNPLACACTAPFVFDTSYTTCRIDCSQASTKSNGTQFEYDSCYCTAANTAWNYTGNTCSLYINCSNGVYVNALTCACNSGFIFNSTFLTCVRDCSSINQAATLNTANTTQCVCLSGLFYNSVFNSATNPQGVCQRNCSLFDKTLAQSTTDPLACTCSPGYYFITSGTVGCTLNCSIQAYSTGVNKNSTTCVCQKNYFFDNVINQCIANSHYPLALVLALAIGIPVGVLILIAIALILCFAFTPAAPLAPPIMPMPRYAPQMIQPPITETRIIPTNYQQPVTATRIIPSNSMSVSRPSVSRQSVRYGGVPRF
jgi:hypothetical protein